MNGYIAFYKNKRIEIHAETTLEAQEKAAAHFRVKRWYVDVYLAEKDGVPVIHSADF